MLFLLPKNRVPPTAKRLQPYPQRQRFASSTRRFQNEASQATRNSVERNGAEACDEAGFTAVQLAAQKDLEKVLGNALEDIVQKDHQEALIAKAEEYLDNGNGLEDADELGLIEQDPSDDSVIALRDAGSTSVDEAREARQVFGKDLPDDVLEEEEGRLYKRMYGESPGEIEYEKIEDGAEPEIEDASLGGRVDGHGEAIKINDSDVRTAGGRHKESRDVLGDTEEYHALAVADALDAENYEDGADTTDETLHPLDRAHPMAGLGKAGTRPGTISLPKDQYAVSLQNIFADYSNKELKDTSEGILVVLVCPNHR